MMKITILYGAIRNNRQSIRAAKAVEAALAATQRVDVVFIDIKDYDLPVMEDRLKDMEYPDDRIVSIGKALGEADGIILISPEYNNSYSGALKNAVDYFTKEWSHKPIGIVTASNGIQGGINASNLLQLLVLALNAYAIPVKLLVPEVDKNITEDGVVSNDRLSGNLKKFIAEFLWFTEAIVNQKKLKPEIQ